MKRVLSFVLAATTALMLSSCGSAPDSSSSAAASAASGSPETASAVPAEAAPDFPKKDITFLVPYAAGGSSDQMARLMGNYAKKHMGVNIIIENIPGGGGNVGLNELAQKAPDGYYVGSANTTMNLQPIYGSTEHDYLDIFAPIALCVGIPIAITVPADSPFQTIEDLIAFAKENPGKLKYAHAGVGSITHVTAELFGMEAGIKMTQVPFSSGADALTALLGSQVDVNVAALSEVLSHHNEGTARILAMCTDTQVAEIPTLVSKGMNVNMKVTQGICTLKDVDPAVLKILDEGFGKIIQDPEYQAELQKLGMNVDYLNAADFGTMLQEQRKTFVEVVTASGILDMVKSQQK